VVLMILAFTVQNCVFPLIPFLTATPNLLLILTFSFGFIYGKKAGLLYGLFAGILLDLFYSGPFGFYTLLFINIGYFNGICTQYYYEDYINLPLVMILAFIALAIFLADQRGLQPPAASDLRHFHPRADAAEPDADLGYASMQIKNGQGYDHNYVLNKTEEGELSFAARIKDPVSCRTMEVYTTEPGLQMYTGNFLAGISGQFGATFPRRSAVCFEAQKFPDTPNHTYFPSCRLNPGETYTQKTIYKFGIDK
jgi:rod shape-determining protein MreD